MDSSRLVELSRIQRNKYVRGLVPKQYILGHRRLPRNTLIDISTLNIYVDYSVYHVFLVSLVSSAEAENSTKSAPTRAPDTMGMHARGHQSGSFLSAATKYSNSPAESQGYEIPFSSRSQGPLHRPSVGAASTSPCASWLTGCFRNGHPGNIDRKRMRGREVIRFIVERWNGGARS